MVMHSDAVDDYAALGAKLAAVLVALGDPKAKASGSDAAACARGRRMLGESVAVDRVADLRADYDALGDALSWSFGSGAAAVVQERRMIRKLLEALERPQEVALVDQLAQRRTSRTKSGGAAGRRSKSG
jgi:hypothetical protein